MIIIRKKNVSAAVEQQLKCFLSIKYIQNISGHKLSEAITATTKKTTTDQLHA